MNAMTNNKTLKIDDILTEMTWEVGDLIVTLLKTIKRYLETELISENWDTASNVLIFKKMDKLPFYNIASQSVWPHNNINY